MSKYNVFIVDRVRSEDLIDALNEVARKHADFNPLLKPHEYLAKEHKEYLKPLLTNNSIILRFNQLKTLLTTETSVNKVNNEVLSAYLKQNGFHPFKVQELSSKSQYTLWKHQDNILC